QVEAQLHRRWAAVREGVGSLSHKKIMELAGEWYRELTQTHEEEPGPPEQWRDLQDLLADGLQHLDGDGDGVHSPEYNPRQAEVALKPIIRLEPWLEARGLFLDRATYLKLLREVASAYYLAAETLHRRARGDYAPDRLVEKF